MVAEKKAAKSLYLRRRKNGYKKEIKSIAEHVTSKGEIVATINEDQLVQVRGRAKIHNTHVQSKQK